MREHVFIRPKQQLRPFSTSAGIHCRGCSLPLQRAIVDFGADHAFGRVPKKLLEHYGISLPVSTIQRLTERHAKHMLEHEKLKSTIPSQTGCAVQIGEMDGSMIPIVERDEKAKDKRKNKHLCWKEARLSIVHEKGNRSPKFGAVFQGTVEEAGQCLLNTAILAGFGPQTQLHAVGDGAPWIAEQVQDKFGTQGHYLLDFYHVCEYLSAASPQGTPEESPKAWLENQKNALKNNDYQQVLQTLETHLEAEDIKPAPVRACYRYLSNRTDQLDYKTALENDLPIGSGEIESAHRYVIQERLKLPGAWWKATHADSMLALRIVRANEQWDDYWEQAKAT